MQFQRRSKFGSGTLNVRIGLESREIERGRLPGFRSAEPRNEGIVICQILSVDTHSVG